MIEYILLLAYLIAGFFVIVWELKYSDFPEIRQIPLFILFPFHMVWLAVVYLIIRLTDTFMKDKIDRR
ncbi:MAG: hypothetical protein GOVbin4162_137 [Prokaryotic dsDNA virus sp.]|nr:MAG: hypothetical protein GOVbin4162_137 [Prokaryotic dsDNA virus sp.]|tara:strand:- start:3000 stop:3203 length:204 start_codon:yes stop_codon:yes gene_type:complete